MIRYVIVMVCFSLPAGQCYAQTEVGDPGFRKLFPSAVLALEGAHACHRMEIYLARTREQRARGLMFVRTMPADNGMLFVYDGNAVLSMWMKNTIVPLDIVFITERGEIANIARMTTPFSQDSIAAAAPVRFVLELNAGKADELGLTDGQIILIPELAGI